MNRTFHKNKRIIRKLTKTGYLANDRVDTIAHVSFYKTSGIAKSRRYRYGVDVDRAVTQEFDLTLSPSKVEDLSGEGGPSRTISIHFIVCIDVRPHVYVCPRRLSAEHYAPSVAYKQDPLMRADALRSGLI
ncbi:unnamed protein product, partial [Iphiclides podalirius]